MPKSVGCSYDNNFKLMIIKHVGKTNNCTAWHGNSVPCNTTYNAREKKYYY
jgi:hypothetical protein